jgi:hypothetical protein
VSNPAWRRFISAEIPPTDPGQAGPSHKLTHALGTGKATLYATIVLTLGHYALGVAWARGVMDKSPQGRYWGKHALASCCLLRLHCSRCVPLAGGDLTAAMTRAFPHVASMGLRLPA